MDTKFICCKRRRLGLLTTVITLLIPTPSLKKLLMVKVTDMFCIAIWKFYYKLRINLLPPYFNYMKPNLRHEIFPEFFRPQRLFSWKSQIRFNIYGGGGGTINCVCPLAVFNILTIKLFQILNRHKFQV